MFSKSKIAIRKFEKQITVWGIYLLNELVSKIWYQSADKCGTYEHLGAYTPINATFSKSKIGLKNKLRKTDCGMNYLPPEQTRVDKYEPHKHLGAYKITNVHFSKS